MATEHALEISPSALKHGLVEQLHALATSRIGDESRGKSLELIGHAMGLMIADKLELRGKAVGVAATADDMDALGASFVRALADHGASVRIACLWLHRSTIQHVYPEPREIAQIVQEYVEPFEEGMEHLFLLEAASSKPSIMETFVLRLSKVVGGADIHVLTPITVGATWLEIKERLPADLAARLQFSAMSWAREEAPGLLPSDYSHHFPQFLIERMRRERGGDWGHAGPDDESRGSSAT